MAQRVVTIGELRMGDLADDFTDLEDDLTGADSTDDVTGDAGSGADVTSYDASAGDSTGDVTDDAASYDSTSDVTGGASSFNVGSTGGSTAGAAAGGASSALATVSSDLTTGAPVLSYRQIAMYGGAVLVGAALLTWFLTED